MQGRDIIYLRDLNIDTVVGVFEWERRIRQIVSLSLEMAAPVQEAAGRDEIEGTLDYKAVAKRVTDFVQQSEFKLVETLADRVADLVQREFDVPWLRLELSKPRAVRGARDVGVIIERGCG